MKEHVLSGSNDGPYTTCVKFSEIKEILEKKYGETTSYEAKKILELAFPGAATDRTTYMYGVRLRSSSGTSSHLLASQQAFEPSAVSLLTSENAKLKEKISNLESRLECMDQSSLMIANNESQTEQLISRSCISDGPNTIEHINSFSISAMLDDIKAKAPDLLQLFQTLGKTCRNLSESDLGLAVEQLKAFVSLCTLLNTRCVNYILTMHLKFTCDFILHVFRSNRAKGLQLLISIMLVARATNKQVSNVCVCYR